MRCPACKSIVLINDTRCRKCNASLTPTSNVPDAGAILQSVETEQSVLREKARSEVARSLDEAAQSPFRQKLDGQISKALGFPAATTAESGATSVSGSARAGAPSTRQRGEGVAAARVSMKALPFFNPLLAHAGAPVAPMVRIEASRERLAHARLILRVEPESGISFAAVDLPDLEPGELFGVKDLKLATNHHLLRDLPEARDTLWTAEVRCGDTVVGSAAAEVSVQPLREWIGLAEAADSLAGLVTPNDPAVKSFVNEIGESFTAYQSGRREVVLEQVVHLFEAIRTGGFRYIQAPPSFEGTGQKVRFPFELLGECQGTCLDWCVLMSALLEYTGIHPMVVMMPGHAFHAVWLDDVDPGGQAPSPDDYRDLVRDKMILPFNSTTYFDEADTFQKAVELAMGFTGDVNQVIDIGVCRRQGIRPVPIRG